MNDVKDPPAVSPLAPSITTTSMYGESTPVPPPARTSTTPAPAPAPARRSHLSSLLGTSLNKAAHLVGSEGWWPTPLPSECDKAARILHSFTSSSSSASSPATTHASPKHPTGLTKNAVAKIPTDVLRNARGLAIFNTLRLSPGHGSLAAGSGLVVARRPDGSWSAPSAFVVTTLGAGFSLGVDMYEVVCVLNTEEHVRAFTRPRLSLGGEMSIALGPTGGGMNVEAAISKSTRPVWSYMKSRGFWIGVQIDGTAMVARHDANEAFYGRRVEAADILLGSVEWPEGGKALLEVLKGVDRQLVGEHVVPETALVPQVQYRDEVPENENREALPPAYDAEEGRKDDEGVMDEKERLARAGY